ARLRNGVLEGGDAERLGGGTGRCGARLAAAEPRLERARDGHCRRAGKPGRKPLADAACDPLCRAHGKTSARWVSGAGAGAASPRASSRSSRCSPTRSAFAIAVSAGLTAAPEGKKLVSTT